jgi:hypothetical protein
VILGNEKNPIDDLPGADILYDRSGSGTGNCFDGNILRPHRRPILRVFSPGREDVS